MNTRAHPLRRWRTILDGLLIILIILFATASTMSSKAEVTVPAHRIEVGENRPLPDLYPAGSQPPATALQLDDNTLAGMIAAENAALGIPSYFIDLPMIVR